MRTDCLSVPEIDDFINVDIPDMLQRDDIAVYRQIGERHVSAGPQPGRNSHILVVYHEPHDLTKMYAHRTFSRKSKHLRRKVSDAALDYCNQAYAVAIEKSMAKHPIGQGPLCIMPADGGVFLRMPEPDGPSTGIEEFIQHVTNVDFSNLLVGTFRVGYYNYIAFAVTPVPSAPRTFIVQTSDTRDQKVLTTDFAEGPRNLRSTLEKVCRQLPKLANPEAHNQADLTYPNLG